jgi:hypothetical protein
MIKPISRGETERRTAGVKGGADKMFKKQSAGPAKAGQTGKNQTPAPGAKSAKGGPLIRGVSLSKPAAKGRTAPLTKGR